MSAEQDGPMSESPERSLHVSVHVHNSRGEKAVYVIGQTLGSKSAPTELDDVDWQMVAAMVSQFAETRACSFRVRKYVDGVSS